MIRTDTKRTYISNTLINIPLNVLESAEDGALGCFLIRSPFRRCRGLRKSAGQRHTQHGQWTLGLAHRREHNWGEGSTVTPVVTSRNLYTCWRAFFYVRRSDACPWCIRTTHCCFR